MRILLIGGTRFIGRHVVESALGAGHDVTIFHRGQHGTDLFPDVEHRLGDRNSDLSALAEGNWDATVDTCAYFPRQVHELADVLGDRAGHYQQVSSVSAYASPSLAAIGRTLRWRCSTTRRRGGHGPDLRRTQGALRTRRGRAVRAPQHRRASDLRRRARRLHVAVPVVGGADRPWRRRARTRPGRRAVTAHRRPGHGGLDGRPARAGRVRRIPRGRSVARPSPGASSSRPSPRRSRHRARHCSGWTRSSCSTEAVGEDALPLWPGVDPDVLMMTADPAAALATGLRLRPLAETVRDTLAWTRTLSSPRSRGSVPPRRSPLLEKWQAQRRV